MEPDDGSVGAACAREGAGWVADGAVGAMAAQSVSECADDRWVDALTRFSAFLSSRAGRYRPNVESIDPGVTP